MTTKNLIFIFFLYISFLFNVSCAGSNSKCLNGSNDSDSLNNQSKVKDSTISSSVYNSKIYLPPIDLKNAADSIVITLDDYKEAFIFHLTREGAFMQSSKKNSSLVKVPDDELFYFASLFFVDKLIPIELTDYNYDFAVLGGGTVPKFNVKIYRGKNIFETNVNLKNTEGFYNRIYSKQFNNFKDRLKSLIKYYPLFQNYRVEESTSRGFVYSETKKYTEPKKIIIKYWNKPKKINFYTLELYNDTIEFSFTKTLKRKKSTKTSYELTKYIPMDSILMELAVNLFITKNKPVILNKRLVNDYNRYPQELLEVYPDHEIKWDPQIIDTHVEDQIIEYSPEFNEFMDRLRKLIEKAEKESK